MSVLVGKEAPDFSENAVIKGEVIEELTAAIRAEMVRYFITSLNQIVSVVFPSKSWFSDLPAGWGAIETS